MAGQLCYEDVEVGTEVPCLVKNPGARQLVLWAAGSGDFYEVHYDQELARSTGLPDVIVHGRLKAAYLTQMITDWIGEWGTVRKFSVRYRETDPARQPITCRGRVGAKYERDGERWIECEVWTENAKGQQTTTGSFVFTLPARG
ncbi:MAG: dehydratase [Chloroflexota bacterium]|nr:MAG: dehydratase [Chloroflexota bacterium]